jgi:peptide/nickel transport system permease protein
MHYYVIRRILYLIPVMLIVVTFVFFMVHLIPGDPAAVMAGDEATPEDIEYIRHLMGLDRPIYEQYGKYVLRVLKGDLGESLFLERPVTSVIAERLEVTVLLTFFSLVVALIIGIPAGVIAGVFPNTWSDKTTMVVAMAMLGISMPSFWLGLNLIYFFSLKVKLFPPGGYVSMSSSPVKCIYYMLLPSISLGFASAALKARILRSCMIEVMTEDYIRTARAKGLAERVVIYIHALRNAMVPIMTVIGIGDRHIRGPSSGGFRCDRDGVQSPGRRTACGNLDIPPGLPRHSGSGPIHRRDLRMCQFAGGSDLLLDRPENTIRLEES